MPVLETKGASSAQGFGLTTPVRQPTYIEEVFSTWLYTGTGASQAITNGIDLSGKGGLVWIKSRNEVANNWLMDTERLPLNSFFTYRRIVSNDTSANLDYQQGISSFNSSGFVLDKAPDGGSAAANNLNSSGQPFVSWTFREQPKFFDIVTYTGDGTTSRQISHNLGSVPGCILFKNTSNTGNWVVWHRGIPNGAYTQAYLRLNGNFGVNSLGDYGFSLIPTSTVLNIPRHSNIGNTSDSVNVAGETYVAYLFAHDAGGFGNTGTDNVISCGSFNYSTFPQTVSLGWEPQWLFVKQSDGAGGWIMYDNMRGFTTQSGGVISVGRELLANSSAAEITGAGVYYGGATGFNLNLPSYGNYIYIAIRRGPMKTPTVGTSVFSPVARTGTGSVATINVGFAPDFLTTFYRTDPGQDKVVFDRLRGPTQYLNTAATTQEINVSTNGLISFNSTSFTTNANGYANNAGSSFVNHVFGRAPGFFDEVCYTGTGSARTVAHNLGVAPEMMIVKNRSTTQNWVIYSASLGNTNYVLFTTAATVSGSTIWNSTNPTSSVFSIGTSLGVNGSGNNLVAYLFASCPSVSKVGSYTGTAATLTVNCGFTSGARFVLIKRTDSTGDWYVWDSARGITAGDDPYLLLNSTAAEVTGTNYVDTDSTGFKVTAAAPAGLNASGGTYIFLAIA
jgi:hypothetical protein